MSGKLNTVPSIDNLEQRFGFTEGLNSNVGSHCYVLLNLPGPVNGPAFEKYGKSCVGAYAVRVMPKENIPYGQVCLAVWRSMDRFNQSAPADGLVEMSSSLAQSSSSFKKTWLRLGVSIYAREDEIDKLMTDGDNDTLREILADGRWRPDGESYIPEVTVEEFNAANGTSYEGEPEFNL